MHIGGELDCSFEFTDEIELVFEYRRRVTLADPYPMTVTIRSDNRSIPLMDLFDNVGKGSIVFKSESNGVKVIRDSKVIATVEGRACPPYSDYESGMCISVGTLDLHVE